MIKEKMNGVEIIYEQDYIAEKKIIKENYKYLSNLINELWGLSKPENIRIFITDSYAKYSLHAYSFIQKLMILIILPYWYIQIKRTINDIGAIGTNAILPSILIKSMKFFESTNSCIERLIYKKFRNIAEKYKHGFTRLIISVKLYELKCSKWLGSGICSMTSEKFLSRDIVKKETINMFANNHKEKNNVYSHVVGYWTVRYLEENYPGFLKETFKKYKGEEIVKEIGKKLSLDTNNKERFWKQLDELLYDNYKYLLNE